MKKETVKRELHQFDGYFDLIEHISEFLPDEAGFAIFQVDPDGSLQILHPIQRPGFSEMDVKEHIQSDSNAKDAFQRLIDFISEPVLIEISDGGEFNKISVPKQG